MLDRDSGMWDASAVPVVKSCVCWFAVENLDHRIHSSGSAVVTLRMQNSVSASSRGAQGTSFFFFLTRCGVETRSVSRKKPSWPKN